MIEVFNALLDDLIGERTILMQGIVLNGWCLS